MAKKKEEKKEEKPKKQTSKSAKKYLIKDLFEKADIDDDVVNEILIANGIFQSIEETDIKLTESQFKEVLNYYNNKRL